MIFQCLDWCIHQALSTNYLAYIDKTKHKYMKNNTKNLNNTQENF